MNSIIDQITNGTFLSAASHLGQPRWYDSDEKYLENLKTQPADWYYRHNKVSYSLNSDGYRAPEFNKIDWDNSIFIFGCSQAFGVGVDDADTVAAQLEKITCRPVINLGLIGSSMLASFYNAIKLKNICNKPLAVVNMWTSYNRTVFYDRLGPVHCGSWNADSDKYSSIWLSNDINPAFHGIFISMASKHLWQNTKYYECSLFDDTATLLKCDPLYSGSSDWGRDLTHQGRGAYHIIAKKIAEVLNF